MVKMEVHNAPSNERSLKPSAPVRRGWSRRLLADVLYVVTREKKWWLLPLIALLLMLTGLLIFAAASGPLAPFIYPLL